MLSIRGDEVGINEDTIKTIVRRILKVYKADRIILFGSAAAGQMTCDSDIDLLVVRKGVKDRLTESVKINEALRGMGYPFDINVMPLERFEETKNTIGGLAYPANKYGKVIYAKAA
jgi:predicted nucleotidyltransferase